MYNPVVEEISKEWIKKSISNSFSSMFLTMLSIIQGVALGFLAVNIPVKLEGWHNIISNCGLENLLLFLTTLLIIIILWHSYFWLAVVAKWTPLIWDSLFMFLIGAIELIAVKNIGNPIWFYAMTLLGIVGGFQYLYNVARLPEMSWANDTKEKDKDIGDYIRGYKTKRGWWLITISFVFLVATILFHIYSPNLLWIVSFGILTGQCWALWKHLSDQKETLNRIGTISN